MKHVLSSFYSITDDIQRNWTFSQFSELFIFLLLSLLFFSVEKFNRCCFWTNQPSFKKEKRCKMNRWFGKNDPHQNKQKQNREFLFYLKNLPIIALPIFWFQNHWLDKGNQKIIKNRCSFLWQKKQPCGNKANHWRRGQSKPIFRPLCCFGCCVALTNTILTR